MNASMNTIIMLIGGIIMSVSYVISVSPAQLEKKMGHKAYPFCGAVRIICMIFMGIVTLNYILYKFYPLHLPLPAAFPWPYWLSLSIAAVIGIPASALCLFAVLTAGSESIAPQKDHTMYKGIYKKIRHPQAVSELPIFFVIALLLDSLHLFLFSFIWIPVWYWFCIAEEKDLLLRYGDAYRAYMKSSGRFFPKRGTQ